MATLQRYSNGTLFVGIFIALHFNMYELELFSVDFLFFANALVGFIHYYSANLSIGRYQCTYTNIMGLESVKVL